MSEYGQYSYEAEVRAKYEDAKREVYGEGHGPLPWLAVVALWFFRQRSIRRLRRMDRREAAK